MVVLSQRWRWGGVLALFVLIVGCGDENETVLENGSMACVPGTQQECACEGVYQECKEDGSGFTSCECSNIDEKGGETSEEEGGESPAEEGGASAEEESGDAGSAINAGLSALGASNIGSAH